ILVTSSRWCRTYPTPTTTIPASLLHLGRVGAPCESGKPSVVVISVGAVEMHEMVLWACQGPPIDLTDALGQRWNAQTNGQITGVFGNCLSVAGSVWSDLVITHYCRVDDPGQEWDSVA